MDLIADALLIAGALGAALYCRTLARRLGALKDLDSGLGAAIAALSRQVDELRASLDAAKSVSGDQTREVAQLTARAEMAAGRLELLLAALHEGEEQRPVGARTSRQRAAARPKAAATAGTAALRLEAGEDDETEDDRALVTRPALRAERAAPAAAPAAVEDRFEPLGRHAARRPAEQRAVSITTRSDWP